MALALQLQLQHPLLQPLEGLGGSGHQQCQLQLLLLQHSEDSEGLVLQLQLLLLQPSEASVDSVPLLLLL